LGKHQTVLAQGEDASKIWAVRSGSVKLERFAHEHTQIVEILRPGDIFGFSSVAGGSYVASAETLAPSELCCCTRDTLRQLISESPDLGVRLLEHVHEQLRRARVRLSYLSHPRAKDRLAAYLHDRFAVGDEIPNDLTLRQLGGLLGLAPETVCRAIKQLREDDILDVHPRSIRLKDRAALRELVAD
jgi:CRP/FNR family transcriptional regulator